MYFNINGFRNAQPCIKIAGYKYMYMYMFYIIQNEKKKFNKIYWMVTTLKILF